jgi:two-component system, LuxR family, sensor histidine kinase DctS
MRGFVQPRALPVLGSDGQTDYGRLIARLTALAVILFMLLATAVFWLSLRFEQADRQSQLEGELQRTAFGIRTVLNDHVLALRQFASAMPATAALQPLDAQTVAGLLHSRPEAVVAQVRGAQGQVLNTQAAMPSALVPIGNVIEVVPYESRVAMEAARRNNTPSVSAPYFVAAGEGVGFEAIDLWAPVLLQGEFGGALRMIISLPQLLAYRIDTGFARDHEISLTEPDGTLLARRVSPERGRGVYTASQLIDLPGTTMLLKANSLRGAPSLVPNAITGIVIALSVALTITLALLIRSVARRFAGEQKLAAQEAFRRAMEDSLVTGLRARDMQGMVTYVNPAFCAMVGYTEQELLGRKPPMPYWPAEARDEYTKRLSARLSGSVTRELFEAEFVHKEGGRVFVWVAESPLLDQQNRQTGWMASVLDVTEKKKIEELNRQQEEKLAATARLTSMGEVASMLAHELNQPLAAISSYVTGSLNMLKTPAPPAAEVTNALEHAQTQAKRAGAIIHSVQNFVKRRQPVRERVRLADVVGNVMPLIELLARKYTAHVQIDVSAALPKVDGDRILLEQVVLNLARNGIEAMKDTPPAQRILSIDARQTATHVTLRVADHGRGIDTAEQQKLFTPFYSTKPEGMGMGLSICRSVAESHGGRLSFLPNGAAGTIFELSLPI